jgi:predicted RNA-binding Zn ribbon-like protein
MSGTTLVCDEGAGLVRGQPEGLCLAFVNTVAWRKAAASEERLPSPAALLQWCVDAGILGTATASDLRRVWAERPETARAVHRQAVALREALYAVLRARIASEEVPAKALRVLNDVLQAAPRRVELSARGHVLAWSVEAPAADAPGPLLAPIAWSAADLLTGPRAERVRQCADERGCGWLFLDESRAGTRRWCSMGDCGNRAKARRHHLRSRRSAAGPPDDPDPSSS